MQTSVDLWLYIAVPSSSVSMWCWGYVCLIKKFTYLSVGLHDTAKSRMKCKAVAKINLLMHFVLFFQMCFTIPHLKGKLQLNML